MTPIKPTRERDIYSKGSACPSTSASSEGTSSGTQTSSTSHRGGCSGTESVPSDGESSSSSGSRINRQKSEQLQFYFQRLREMVPGTSRPLSRVQLIHSAIDYITDLQEALEARARRKLTSSTNRPPLVNLQLQRNTNSTTSQRHNNTNTTAIHHNGDNSSAHHDRHPLASINTVHNSSATHQHLNNRSSSDLQPIIASFTRASHIYNSDSSNPRSNVTATNIHQSGHQGPSTSYQNNASENPASFRDLPHNQCKKHNAQVIKVPVTKPQVVPQNNTSIIYHKNQKNSIVSPFITNQPGTSSKNYNHKDNKETITIKLDNTQLKKGISITANSNNSCKTEISEDDYVSSNPSEKRSLPGPSSQPDCIKYLKVYHKNHCLVPKLIDQSTPVSYNVAYNSKAKDHGEKCVNNYIDLNTNKIVFENFDVQSVLSKMVANENQTRDSDFKTLIDFREIQSLNQSSTSPIQKDTKTIIQINTAKDTCSEKEKQTPKTEKDLR